MLQVRGDARLTQKQVLNLIDGNAMLLALLPISIVPIKARELDIDVMMLHKRIYNVQSTPLMTYSPAPLPLSSARCTLARLTPIDRATDDTDDPEASRFLACSALSPISFAGRPPARPRAFAAATPAL